MIVAGDNIREVASEHPEAYAHGSRGLRDLQLLLPSGKNKSRKMEIQFQIVTGEDVSTVTASTPHKS